MAYIYKKRIGNKDYYYLRASVKKGDKVITKDLAYLGNDSDKIKDNLDKIPTIYTKEIRKTYRTIKRFIEINHYLQKVKKSKIRFDEYLEEETLQNVEATRLHWNNNFKKLDMATQHEILKHFIVEFAFNTTSIEGNTITLKEAQKLLIENLTPKNKTLREIYDLQNTEKVFFELYKSRKGITHDTICKIHDKLLENIDLRKGYRKDDVRVFRMNFKSTPAEYVKADMDLLLRWYQENEDRLHPLVLATLFHHKFEKIHPFMDGNGRTGRMTMNLILMKKSYPPIIVCKRLKHDYINKLNRADRIGLVESDIKGYKDLVNFIAKELINNYWNIFL